MCDCKCFSEKHSPCRDYYWRDYSGTIPVDAVPAGKDSNGDLRYVGVAYIRGYETLPVTILPKEKVGTAVAYDKILRVNKHIRILCSPYKEALVWTQIHHDHLPRYLSWNLIPGGSEIGHDVGIGRVFRNNNVIVGKLFLDDPKFRGLGFPNANRIENSLTYEILAFDCKKAMIQAGCSC